MDLSYEYGKRINAHVKIFIIAATALSGILLSFNGKNNQVNDQDTKIESEVILEHATD